MAFEFPSTKTAKKEKAQKEMDAKVEKAEKIGKKKLKNLQDLKRHNYTLTLLKKETKEQKIELSKKQCKNIKKWLKVEEQV